MFVNLQISTLNMIYFTKNIPKAEKNIFFLLMTDVMSNGGSNRVVVVFVPIV